MTCRGAENTVASCAKPAALRLLYSAVRQAGRARSLVGRKEKKQVQEVLMLQSIRWMLALFVLSATTLSAATDEQIEALIDLHAEDTACLIHYAENSTAVERQIFAAQGVVSHCRFRTDCHGEEARETLALMRQRRAAMQARASELDAIAPDSGFCDKARGYWSDALTRFDVNIRDMEALAR